MATTHTQTPGPDAANSMTPEWLTVAQGCKYAAVSKPVLYNWMNRGLVKNFSMKERGQIRGVRRIHFDSLRAFMDSRSSGGQVTNSSETTAS
jgi:hypothetical protein